MSDVVLIPDVKPFESLISLDYYDGTTAGAAKLKEDRGEIWFEMDWEHVPTETRFYTVWTLPNGSVDLIRSELSPFIETDKKYLYPNWDFAPPEILDQISRRIDVILGARKGPSFLVTSEEITKSIDQVVELRPDVFRKLQELVNNKSYSIRKWRKLFVRS